MPTNNIHVALASDDAYFMGLITTAYSLLKSCHQPGSIVIHVLDGGLSSSHRSQMAEMVKRFSAQLEFITINQDVFKKLAPWHGSGKMAYARLLLPDLLPTLDFIIYCDTDFLWQIDVQELWEQRSSTKSLQYVRDRSRTLGNIQEDLWLKSHDLDLDREHYFCTGLLLINLTKFREERIHIEVLNLLYKTNGSAPFPDQTTLNVILSKRKDTAELDDRWQNFTCDRKVIEKGARVVLHYAADCPWKPLTQTNHLLTDLHLLWHRTYADMMGISTWRSLRQENSATMIIGARLLYLLICHSPLFKKSIKLFQKVRHRDVGFLDTVFRLRV